MGFAEAMHDSGVVITSCPGPTSRASRATCSAAVPVLVATAWAVAQSLAKAASSSRTRAPWVIQPLAITSWTARASSGPTSGRATGMRQLIALAPRRVGGPRARSRPVQRLAKRGGDALDLVAREPDARRQVDAAA